MNGVFAAAVAPFTRQKQKDREPSGRPLLPSIVTGEGSAPTSPGPPSSVATVVPTRHRSPPSYGATSNWESPSRSPERTRRDALNRVPEESAVNFEGDILDEDDPGSEVEELVLEEQGLYRGWFLFFLYQVGV